MKQRWFKRRGWIYIPVNPLGYIVTGLAIIFIVPVVLAIDRNTYSITDELYKIFIYGTCIAFWWKWVADKTSHHR